MQINIRLHKISQAKDSENKQLIVKIKGQFRTYFNKTSI